MSPIQISLVSLGTLKHPIDITKLQGWKSQIIKIIHATSVGHLPDSVGLEWEYPDSQLLEVFRAETNTDFTLGIIDASLEGNYYLRRLSDKVAVLSLHEVADIIRYSELSIEQYILRSAYELAVLFAANKKLLPDDVYTWAHDETRGCLFDMNANKSDIVFSLHRPILCATCRTRVSAKQVPSKFLPTLDKELPRIQKALYVRMTEWIKQHPLLALIIAAISSITLNLIASILFEKGWKILSWLS